MNTKVIFLSQNGKKKRKFVNKSLIVKIKYMFTLFIYENNNKRKKHE